MLAYPCTACLVIQEGSSFLLQVASLLILAVVLLLSKSVTPS